MSRQTNVSSNYYLLTINYQNGPCPIQLVVVIAVRNAVSAATITFTTVSRMSRFIFIKN